MDNKIKLVNTGVYVHWFNIPFLGLVNIRVRYNNVSGEMSLYISLLEQISGEHLVLTEKNNGTEEEAEEMMRKYNVILHEGLDKILGR